MLKCKEPWKTADCSRLLSDEDNLIREVMMPEESNQPKVPTSKMTPASSQDSIPDVIGSEKESIPEGEDIPPMFPKLKLKVEDLDLQIAYLRSLGTPYTPSAEDVQKRWKLPNRRRTLVLRVPQLQSRPSGKRLQK